MNTSKDQEKLPIIIQPNAVTSARYDFTQLQKDFMYHFIDRMNKYMTKDREFIRDLFGNLVIEINLKDIVRGSNYTEMLNAIRDLQKRTISYHYNRQDGTYDVTTHLIASLVHKRGTGRITLKTTEESLPFISFLGEGFTSYNKMVALSLPSYYAKRMYELCCRWKDKGFYRTTLKEFRKMMMVEDKFVNVSDLKRYVIDMSERMMSKDADLTFTYTLRKENGSKAFNWMELYIVPTEGELGNKSGWYTKLYNILYQIYRDSTAMFVCDYIADRENLKKAAERFTRLQKDIDSGKIKVHGILAYVNKVLENEFEVPESVTTSKTEKEKKKKRAEKVYKRLTAEKAKKEAAEKAESERQKRSAKEIIKGMIAGEAEKAKRSGTRKIGDLFKKD
jgi:plasmid replication initiation protein